MYSFNYHYNGKSVCIFQIKAFYLKKLHFNSTFSLDPVSIIYNYKQGFEEMIWISPNYMLYIKEINLLE
jgi:hypothetical protein